MSLKPMTISYITVSALLRHTIDNELRPGPVPGMRPTMGGPGIQVSCTEPAKRFFLGSENKEAKCSVAQLEHSLQWNISAGHSQSMGKDLQTDSVPHG